MSADNLNLPAEGLLEDLSAEERTTLQNYGDIVHHDKGDSVVEQGVAQSFLHLVVSGELQVKLHSPEAIIPLGYVDVGGCVGEMSLLEPVEASAQVAATAPTNVWALSRSRFDQFLAENPIAGCKLLKSIATLLARRLRKGSQRLLDAQ
jgi:CRP/FNR family transcriptional regulator, cyclic AMP receptor protein